MVNFVPLFQTLLTVGLLGNGFEKIVDNFDDQRSSHADEHKYLDRLNPKQFAQFFTYVDATGGKKEEEILETAKKLAEDPKIAQSAKLLVVDTLKANNISENVIDFVNEAGNQAQNILKTINGEENDVPEVIKPLLRKFRKLSSADNKLLEKVLGAPVNVLNSPEAAELIDESPKPKSEPTTTPMPSTTPKIHHKLHDEHMNSSFGQSSALAAAFTLIFAFILY
ncbi:unnamed protein product [Bursaphelenchus xylophilus]|nr:unnamed protein product [Bursaphelenchus xylophilus]CAG9095448.1 unnamed protein product [Bursaphelenchus xylophilus]